MTNSKEQRAKHNRTWYLKHREEQIARANINQARLRIEHTERVVAHLRDNPCIDCGETDFIVLDFDHNDPKEKEHNVSSMIGCFPWGKIEAEIQKCSVRCANCHRRKTARQSGFLRFQIHSQLFPSS